MDFAYLVCKQGVVEIIRVKAVFEHTHPVFTCLPAYRNTVLGQHLQIGRARSGKLTAEKNNAYPASGIGNNNK